MTRRERDRDLGGSRYDEPERRIRVDMGDETKLYRSREKQRVHFSKGRRTVVLCGVAVVVLYVLSIFFVVNLFTQNLSLAWLGKHAIRRAADILDLITGNHLQSGIHFWLCQFATPLVAGIALGASGACFQSLFHNPMASPTMLGVEAGGTLGSALYVVFFYTPVLSGLLSASYEGYALEYHTMTVWQKYGQYFVVFIGCILVVLAVMLLVKVAGRGKLSTVPLMIGGTIFTTSVNAIVNVLVYYESVNNGNPTLLTEIQALQAGTFQSITSPLLLACFAVPALLPMLVMLPLSGRLNILAFGDEQARLLGVSTEKERFVFLMLSTVMTAAVVAFCGAVSFVGLLVPHLARYLVGSDFRHMVPVSAFLGGIFLMLAFDLSYMLNGYLDAGAIVNVVGGVIFVVYMARYRRRGHGRFY